MMLPRTKPWTTDEDSRLKALWRAGLTNAAIGEVIGRSRNAISGRRYRLELPERPSPIAYKVCAASVAKHLHECEAGRQAAIADLMAERTMRRP